MNKIKQMEYVIDDWLSTNLQAVTVTNPISIHLSDLLKDSEYDLITDSLAAYQILVNQLLLKGTPVKPLLVIPLISASCKIEMLAPKSVEEVDQQLDRNESPSLYLIDWKPSKAAVVCEEFCAPLEIDLFKLHDQSYAYYREFRYALGIKHNWEYSRAIYLGYFPDGIHLQ